jgi:hypothetical protein
MKNCSDDRAALAAAQAEVRVELTQPSSAVPVSFPMVVCARCANSFVPARAAARRELVSERHCPRVTSIDVTSDGEQLSNR